MYIYTYSVTTPSAPHALFEQILRIQSMEHGSLSVIGQGPNGPYYNLNSWEDGKNRCRYVPRHRLGDVRRAIAGYRRYQQLTRQYAQLMVERTRAQLGIAPKKEPHPGPRSHPNSSSPKTS